MFNNKKVFSLIPAKHTSYQLPKKNYLKLNKLSLFEIAIICSKKSKFVDSIFVSSDSKHILHKSKKNDVNTIKRDKKLCLRKTLAKELIYDAITFIKRNFFKDFFIIYLQPTSPFRNHKHINKAFKLLKKNKLNSLISVSKNTYPIFKSVKIIKGLVKPIFNEKFISSNREEFVNTYKPNGAIYIFTASSFLKKKNIPIKNSFAYIMPKKNSIDIDNLEDYKLAKKLSKKFLIYKKNNSEI